MNEQYSPVFPEYAKTRTDAKAIEEGGLIKNPKRNSLSDKICQSGTQGIQADFKRYSSEKARIPKVLL
jgi:hypothetical protein